MLYELNLKFGILIDPSYCVSRDLWHLEQPGNSSYVFGNWRRIQSSSVSSGKCADSTKCSITNDHCLIYRPTRPFTWNILRPEITCLRCTWVFFSSNVKSKTGEDYFSWYHSYLKRSTFCVRDDHLKRSSANSTQKPPRHLAPLSWVSSVCGRASGRIRTDWKNFR